MPKNEKELEAKLEQTCEAIEAGLKDIKENKASKQEVLDMIEEKKQEDAEAIKAVQGQVAEVKSATEELKEAAATLGKQLKGMRSNGYAVLKGANGGYSGFFASADEAKAFGLVVMAAATANRKDIADRHGSICKALEGMGIEPQWIDEKGFKTMTGVSQTGGSALVTVQQIPSIIRLFEIYGVFEADALVMPMGAGQTLQPKTSSLLTIYCPGEGGSTSTSDPVIDLISHVAKTLCALTAYSLELDEDAAVGLGELLAFLFARSYAYKIDQIGFLGDGTSTYFGFTGITGALRAVDATIGNIKGLVVAAGNAYSEITLANFESVVGTLPEYADDGFAKWYAHRYFYYTVMVKLALAAGGVTAREILNDAGQRQKMFLSYPLRGTQVMPKAEGNSQICTVFGNLKQGAQLGRRGALEIAQSTERYFEQGLVAVRARRRLSFNVFGVGDTTDAGPITALVMAAS